MVKKRTHYSVLVAIFVVACSLLPVSRTHAESALQCEQHNVPVTLSPTNPTQYNLFGQLCWQGSKVGKTVELLVAGGTYDHNYWDFPLDSAHYSYVRAAADAGYVTFNIDRIGNGLSSHPPADQVTLQSEAYTHHLLIQDLRSGAIGGTAFSKVVVVGHSQGSAISWFSAADYPGDINGLIITDALHTFAAPGAAIFSQIIPAQQDPKFANAGLPDGYFTLKDGTRASYFYNTGFADSHVIALDETLKQTTTSGEYATYADALLPSLTQRINVPVLLMVGGKDKVFCDETTPGLSCVSGSAIVTRESSYYSAQACLEAGIQPQAGHSIALHPNAHSGFDAMLNWANRRVGRDASHSPTDPC